MQKTVTLIFCICLLIACTASSNKSSFPQEFTVRKIKLDGKINMNYSEISGLTLYNHNIIILPQYPSRFNKELNKGYLYMISDKQIDFVLNKTYTSIKPDSIILSPLPVNIKGYQGFEAIAIRDNEVYLLIESETDISMGYIIKGKIDEELTKIDLDTSSLKIINTPANIHNTSYESILLTKDKIICIFEANGKNINSNPICKCFDYQLNPIEEINFPNIEYRITDVTNISKDRTFWAINYFYPNDKKYYKPTNDIYIEKYGLSKSHLKREGIERFVKLKVSDNSIKMVDKIPIYLKLENDIYRNWEGIVEYSPNNFIIATDKFPNTILGHIKVQ